MSERTPTYNFKPVVQGADWSVTLTVSDENGNPKDLSGYSAKMQVRAEPNSSVLIELTSTPAAGITVTGVSGTIGIVMTAAETAALTFQHGIYDVMLTSGAGVVTYLLRGEFTLLPRVTR